MLPFPVLGPGTLTSSASLVMGYFSRLEMTSSTATMFRICKTSHSCQSPALCPVLACSGFPLAKSQGTGITQAPTPCSLPPAPRANMAATAHLLSTSRTWYIVCHKPAHVHTHLPVWRSKNGLKTFMKQDLLWIRELVGTEGFSRQYTNLKRSKQAHL